MGQVTMVRLISNLNCYLDQDVGGGANASMLDGGEMGYPNTDIAKDEIIMKLRS